MEENNKLKSAINDFFNTYDAYEGEMNRIKSLKEKLKESEKKLSNIEIKLSNVSEVLIKNNIPEKSIVEHRQKRYIFDLDKENVTSAKLAGNLGNAKHFKRYVIADLKHF